LHFNTFMSCNALWQLFEYYFWHPASKLRPKVCLMVCQYFLIMGKILNYGLVYYKYVSSNNLISSFKFYNFLHSTVLKSKYSLPLFVYVLTRSSSLVPWKGLFPTGPDMVPVPFSSKMLVYSQKTAWLNNPSVLTSLWKPQILLLPLVYYWVRGGWKDDKIKYASNW
jgi:hypothetical protein